MANTLIWIPKRLVELGLLNVAAQNQQGFVNYCETEYENRIFHVAKQIIYNGIHVVMLTGPSASGKTTTAYKIAQELKNLGKNSQVISLDCFFKNVDDYPRLEDGTPDYENVDALDIKRINECLVEIVKTGKTEVPNFDFNSESRVTGNTLVEVGQGVVIVEGIHALNPKLTHALASKSVYKVYAGLREEYSHNGQRILSTRDVRLARRMVRDVKFRGHSIEKTMGMWPAVCEGEDKYIKVFKGEADILLDTSFSDEICLLAPFVEEMRGHLDCHNKYAKELEHLCSRFAICNAISQDFMPKQSMLREFIGD